jgi:hypothetical protein
MSAAGAPMTAADDHPEKGCPGRGTGAAGRRRHRMSGAGDPFHSQIMTLFRRRLSLCASTRFPTAPNPCRRGPPTHCEFLAQAPRRLCLHVSFRQGVHHKNITRTQSQELPARPQRKVLGDPLGVSIWRTAPTSESSGRPHFARRSHGSRAR